VDFQSQSWIKYPTPTPSVVRNPTPLKKLWLRNPALSIVNGTVGFRNTPVGTTGIGVKFAYQTNCLGTLFHVSLKDDSDIQR